MTRIILNGYLGAMGRVITSLVERQKDVVEIVAGVDVAKTKDPAPFPAYGDISDCDMPADVILDVSAAAAVPGVLDYAAKTGTNVIICTTGLSDEAEIKITEASESVAVFRSANMSLGISLINSLLKRAAPLLYEEGFDVEIIEKHHNRKLDAPSGTAAKLAETVNASLGGALNCVYERNSVRRRRDRSELGIHSLRGGTIVGEHSVVFAGRDEVIELSHTAYSREIFAVGALKAVKFLAGKPPGLYDMDDLMEDL